MSFFPVGWFFALLSWEFTNLIFITSMICIHSCNIVFFALISTKSQTQSKEDDLIALLPNSLTWPRSSRVAPKMDRCWTQRIRWRCRRWFCRPARRRPRKKMSVRSEENVGTIGRKYRYDNHDHHHDRNLLTSACQAFYSVIFRSLLLKQCFASVSSPWTSLKKSRLDVRLIRHILLAWHAGRIFIRGFERWWSIHQDLLSR